VHVGLALLHLPLLGFDLLDAEPVRFDHGLLEHLDGSRHLADLIGPLDIGDGQVQLALAERIHAQLQPGERLDHTACHEPGDADRGQQEHGDQETSRLRHAPERDVKIRHVFGGGDHQMPRCKTADIGNLVERGFRPAPGKRVPDRALAAPCHVEHHRGERHSARILQPAYVLADQARIAGVHDAEPGLGVVDEDVVGMAFEPDRTGGGIEAGFRLFLSHRAGLCGVFETLRHAPDGIDDGMRPFGSLVGKLAASDEEDGQGDEQHEQRAGHSHCSEFGCDRMLSNELERFFHDDPPPRTCRSVVSRHPIISSRRRFGHDEDSYQFVNEGFCARSYARQKAGALRRQRASRTRDIADEGEQQMFVRKIGQRVFRSSIGRVAQLQSGLRFRRRRPRLGADRSELGAFDRGGFDPRG
jgi:hypothetical protein